MLLDYHLHLWPRRTRRRGCLSTRSRPTAETAAAAGVTQIALTEHLHRFTQATDVVGRFWERTDDSPAVREAIAGYFDHHARSDLDGYVALCESAKAAGLPVVTGMEVDYYAGQMDAVGALLDGYPFDVLLGSVHWIGAWQFDSTKDPVHMAEWDARDVDACWEGYTRCLEELRRPGPATCSRIPTSSRSPVGYPTRQRSGGTASPKRRPAPA